MGFDDIKKFSIEALSRLPIGKLKEAFKALLNTVEDLSSELKQKKEENQKLRDENRRLKGEKGKPDIKEPKSSKQDEPRKKNPTSSKCQGKGNSSKKGKINVARTERVSVDRNTLPYDAESKGIRSVIIQDIKLEADNIEFLLERFYSPSLAMSFDAQLPPEYQGSEFGPGIRTFVIVMHYQARIPQKLLQRILLGMGVKISEGEIGEILLSDKNEMFHQEKEQAVKAGIEEGSFVQIDDTGARLGGQNWQTIVTCNDDFCSFLTSAKKDRLSALRAITVGGELGYLIDSQAIGYMNTKIGNKSLVQALGAYVGDGFYSEQAFEKLLIGLPLVSKAKDTWKKYIREACAIAAYREGLLGPTSEVLICDDAPQFKDILKYLGLCWVHEGRHYKDLEPSCEAFRQAPDDFMENFWDYYRDLQEYKDHPTTRKKNKLSKRFDELFAGDTDYYALNHIIKKTYEKKDELLLVLDFPKIPLHNNTSELDIREKVVQRKIRNCFRSIRGAMASDTFLSLMATCRKQGLSFWKYVKDRIYQLNKIPPLAEIIEQGGWAVA